MNPLMSGQRPLRVVIRQIGIAAASPLEARRLADALPAALERAFARARAGAPPGPARRPGRIDRVAAEIVRAAAERVGARS
jgi:hypothetical protein